MKLHTPEFKEQLKTLGKELDTKVTYGTNELTSEELNYIKPRFNTELFKTIMKVVEFDSSVKLESKQWINAKIGVRVGEEYELLDFGNCYINDEPKFNVDFSSYTYKAYDKMIESMIPYDSNPLEITYPITYKNLLIAICDKLGWTYELPLTFPNMDKNILYDLYKDLGLTYRDILDDLCPLSMGNFINDGKFKIIYPTETNDTIDDEFLKEDNITIGKKVGPINALVLSRAEDGDKIDRTDSQSITENGLNEIKIKDNIILSSEFRENFIDEMFEKIKGFEYYSIDIATTGVLYYEPLDRFTINHNGVNYSTIALNSEIELEDGLSEIIFAPELEESTTNYETSSQTDKAKKMASIIAHKNKGLIELLTEEQTEQRTRLVSAEQNITGFTKVISDVDDIKSRTATIEENVQGLTNTMKETGGLNILHDAAGYFKNDYWSGPVKTIVNTDILDNTRSDIAFDVQNGTIEQTVNVQNGIYTLSGLFKKLLELANIKITVNDVDIPLDEMNWKQFIYTFEVKSRSITVKVTADTNSAGYVSDLMLNSGDLPQVWSLNQNETYTDNVKIAKGVTIESTNTNTKFEALSDGLRIRNKTTDEVKTEFTDEGTKTDKLTANSAVISQLLIQNINGQVCFNNIGGV